MSDFDVDKIDALAQKALRIVKELHGTYICKCLFVNGVFSLLLENANISNVLVSGKMAGGFNTGEKDTFRYGYTLSGNPDLIDHHVWCVDDNGRIFDAMMLVMDEEMRLTSPSSGEYLLRKNALVSPYALYEYGEIMDDCEIGLNYSPVSEYHPKTLNLLDAFLKQHEQFIMSHL